MAVARKTAKKAAKKVIKKAVKPVKKAAAKALSGAVAKKKPAKTAAKKPAKTIAAKKVVKPAVTVTMRNMGDQLAEEYDISKKMANGILTDMIALMTKNLKKGARIRMPGFGVLQVRKRPARMGRNPATGESIRIKATKKVAFRVAKDLKEAVLTKR